MLKVENLTKQKGKAKIKNNKIQRHKNNPDLQDRGLPSDQVLVLLFQLLPYSGLFLSPRSRLPPSLNPPRFHHRGAGYLVTFLFFKGINFYYDHHMYSLKKKKNFEKPLHLVMFLAMLVFVAAWALSSCSEQASSCGGFSRCRARALGHSGFRSCGSWALEHRLNKLPWPMGAQLPWGLWDLPRPGIKPVSPPLASRFFTTEPPGKAPGHLLKQRPNRKV